MQKFATEFENDEFLQGVPAKLSWNHNQILWDKVKDKEIQKWYAKEKIENAWFMPKLSYIFVWKNVIGTFSFVFAMVKWI